MYVNIGSLLIFLLIIFILFKIKNLPNINFYKEYINLCKKLLRLYPEEKEQNESPFFSICIPVYNMEKYINISIFTVLNQSFRDFEIVIINDFSLDNTENIIKNLQYNNPQIRLINHKENFGIYKSRVDAIKNSKGKFIIFLDPDDLFPNPDFLRDLYEYNLINNIDIIEYTVLMQNENRNRIYYSLDHRINHFHNFNEKIIYHDHLSNILFFENNHYSDVFCRCIWNKMVRKEVFNKTIHFLGNRAYEKDHFDFGEDTIINILNFEFASNYSNLNLVGYLYNFRDNSISHAKEGKEIQLKLGLSAFFFYKLFYKYVKYFNKDLNYLYFDIKAFDYYIEYIKQFSSNSNTKQSVIYFYKSLLKENNISSEFKEYAKQFIINFNKNPIK